MIARFSLRIAGRLIAGLLLAMVAVPIGFVLVAVAFALMPERGRLQQAAGEPPVYVCASLAHADIVLPSRDPLIDWSALLPAVARPNLPPEAGLAFGWGDLRFFRETPAWSDINLATALGALLGRHATAVRVVAVKPPADNPGCMRVGVDRAGRQALIASIEASLRIGADGRPLQQAGGGAFEAYYLATGRYGPLRTCNQWIAEVLAAAGLPHARFAPFSFGVTWPLGRMAVADRKGS
ncbi:DUF2459 domain-containing protein [Labrys monachus]|uniref:Uncharacterized protein (TIGR02117 family) n=1 Tax=Labrys monachus TaxID=217067 RepID=A0ABU0FL01_9HYPH|nr:DUF2459 domain-containing protein [Labrys monachus]MDQ0395042.1 uncharacterized protein (TIGR02117 family) [Labrys monachus]